MKIDFFFLALCAVLTNCDECKDDPKPLTELEKLPPATQVGKNTFGCLVDGKAWVTRSSIGATAFFQEGVFSITAVNSENTEYIYIRMYQLDLTEQVYTLPKENPGHIASVAALQEFKTTLCIFETTAGYTGRLEITHLDQTFGKWIISGTFEFLGYSIDCQRTLSVTDGRFDVTYAP